MLAAVVLYVIALAAGVACQSTCSGTTTISSAAEATAFANCEKLFGKVVIETGVPTNFELGGPEIIEGDIIVKGIPGLKSLALPAIGVMDNLVLEDLPDFEKLTLPTFEAAISGLHLVDLPSLKVFPEDTAVNDGEHLLIQNTAITSVQLGDQYDLIQNVIITGNKHLKSVSSTIKSVAQNLTIIDNSQLKTYSFPKLSSVWDYIEIRGDFTDLQLPSLTKVGNVILESTQDIDNICAKLQAAPGDNGHGLAIEGTLACNGKQLKPGGKFKTTTSSSSQSSRGLSPGAKIGIGIGIGLGALFVVGLIVTLIVRKRRASRATLPEISVEKNDQNAYPINTNARSPKKQLVVVSTSEMERHELEQPPSRLAELPSED